MLCVRKSNFEAVWCEYKPGVKFLINPMTTKVISDLREKCSKKVMRTNPISKEVELMEDIDSKKLGELICDYVLQGWEGIGDEKENDLECTLENKLLVLDIPEVNDFVTGISKKIPVLSDKQLQEELGN